MFWRICTSDCIFSRLIFLGVLFVMTLYTKAYILPNFFFDLFQDFTLKCPKKNLILHNVCFNGIEKITYL